MILGYSLAILIGLSLGLLGGGGSILTVPVLVYALGMEAKVSIALSLAIVGATALIGSITHWRAKNVNFKIAAIFGPVAMGGTFLGAKLSVFMSGAAQLILFAIVMIIASFFMIRGRKDPGVTEEEMQNHKLPVALIVVEGLAVGVLTGLVGVGGGFMIVPALVLLAKVPMKQAIGTSLLIIAMKSFAGFIGYMETMEIPWGFLGMFTVFTAIGIIIGTALVKYVPQDKLKKIFGVFLIVMGIFILYKNKSKLMAAVPMIEQSRQVVQSFTLI